MATLVSCLLPVQAQKMRYVGGDISLLPSYEAVRTPYKAQDGSTISDVIVYAHEQLKWNACRVRLFVNPSAEEKSGGVVQDLGYVVALAKRIQQAGMAFMLDFHYSDTWADPAKQYIPKAWQQLTEQQLLDTVYGYTKWCLDSLARAGVVPEYVQIGNEISYGMLWRGEPKTTQDKVYPAAEYSKCKTQWKRLCAFLNNGAKAVRECCPQAKIIIHIERVAQPQACVNFYSYLAQNAVDYDIIGLSYYPFWHGWLDTELASSLTALHNAFPGKEIQIVETAYYNNYWPQDGTIIYATNQRWAATEAGQDAFLKELIDTLQTYDYVTGLYYWFPEENGNGGASYNPSQLVISAWLNRGLFNPTTHKALQGLYRLQEFLSSSTATPSVSITADLSIDKQIKDGQMIISTSEHSYTVAGQTL